MIPAGYGFEVLKFEDGDLRDIAKLPEDVRIVAALPELAAIAPAGWIHGGAAPRPVFILVMHRYCPRVRAGEPYCFSNIDDFLSRYAALDLEERRELTPMPDHNQWPHEVWHCGKDGKVHEYVWVKDQWVQRGE